MWPEEPPLTVSPWHSPETKSRSLWGLHFQPRVPASPPFRREREQQVTGRGPETGGPHFAPVSLLVRTRAQVGHFTPRFPHVQSGSEKGSLSYNPELLGKYDRHSNNARNNNDKSHLLSS